MKVSKVRKALIAVGLVVVIAGALFVILGVGQGLSESQKKAFIAEFLQEGNQAEAASMAGHPKDERRRTGVFREKIEEIRERLLAKYGLSKEDAEAVFREARQKGWW